MPFLDVKTLVNPLTNFITLHNTGNGASNATNINNAIAAASASGGGVLWFDPGIWPISATIVPANNVTIFAYNVTFQWAGGATATVIGNTNAAILTNFCIFGLTIDCQNTGTVAPFLLTSSQFGVFQDLTFKNTTQTAIQLYATVAFSNNPPYHQNFAANNFRNIRVDSCFAALLMQGTSSNQVVTNNFFYGMSFYRCSNFGIAIVQWTDSNHFYGTEIYLNANNAVGVAYNTGTPGSNVGVYDNNFTDLTIDAFALTGCVAVQLNWTQQNMIRALYTSPSPFTASGTVIQDNNSQSHYIEALSETPAYTSVKGFHDTVLAITAPTATAGANAGTGPPAPVVAAGSTDTAGSLTCGTGTTPAAGNLVNIVFSATMQAVPLAPQITPTTALAASLNPYVASVSATGFTIGVQTAPAASQVNTTYGFSWRW